MASTAFTNAVRAFAQAGFNFNTLSLKVLLVSSVPSEANLDAWVNRSDVTNEIAGTGYTAGGVAQPFTLDALDTANNRQAITLANLLPGWTGATFSAVGGIVYEDTGAAATDSLLEFVDFLGTVSCVAGVFNITYNTKFFVNRI